MLVVIASLSVATGCGGDDETAVPGQDGDAAPQVERAGGDRMDAARRMAADRPGTRLTIRDSQFGDMLFDSKRQAIYIFENDRRGTTVCYGECAKAWPPVVTRGKPIAGTGVDARLLGTVKRRDGTRQVTYAGQPLYYYAHERPGQVLCHNVNLNGGLWWAIGPDGKRKT